MSAPIENTVCVIGGPMPRANSPVTSAIIDDDNIYISCLYQLCIFSSSETPRPFWVPTITPRPIDLRPRSTMLAQRAARQSLRRLAVSPASFSAQMTMKKYAAPMVIASSVQTRPVATQKLTPADSNEILIAQRKLRPSSPHLAIYKPQIPWVLSIMNRITGSVLSGGFYIFGSAYLVAPLFGWHLDSASMAAAFGAWPVAAKFATKMFLAWPFTFHAINGVRHLVWDMGKVFTNKAVIWTGWAVVGLSGASALALATMY
ncbi:SdhC protein [Venustampulla echinocandica]|uniref:SdhC protein n=1 Tax=Venustampulla echinocandica TaxID=2656787 RepID=A0A370TTD3_9HELO|nr:SdhC protein [Venustampulla echinocandica]RDL38773.1 SdhC protein [Venustampulla echinocandica]